MLGEQMLSCLAFCPAILHFSSSCGDESETFVTPSAWTLHSPILNPMRCGSSAAWEHSIPVTIEAPRLPAAGGSRKLNTRRLAAARYCRTIQVPLGRGQGKVSHAQGTTSAQRTIFSQHSNCKKSQPDLASPLLGGPLPRLLF